MFDPSKLGLDLENLEQNKTDKPKPIEGEKVSHEASPQGGDASNSYKNFIEKVSPESENGDIPNLENIDDPLLSISSETMSAPETKDEISEYGGTSHEIYDKSQIEQQIHNEDQIVESKIIFDINITSLTDIFHILLEKDYDFLTIEPTDEVVKISFKKDKIEQETRFIKFPIYNQIILKTKTLCHLQLEETTKDQEGEGEINLRGKSYKILIKTVASAYGEKAFLKLVRLEKTTIKNEKKSVPISTILGFLGAGLFASLIIGGAFLAFVLMNSDNVKDLNFFNSLNVDVSSIKEFTAKLVDIVFASIIFIESIFLFVFTFKAILTKKEFKKKKITRIVLSVFFILLVLISSFIWLTLSKKITSLKGLNYGKIEFFDNSKYLSDIFDENGSKIDVNDRIIGPITIRFNIEQFVKKLSEDGFNIQAITWIFEDEEIEKSISDYEIIHVFDKKGLNTVSLRIDGINIAGEVDSLETEISNINISHLVKITETKLDNGGSIFDYNATDLGNLGKINWYYIPDLSGKTPSEKTSIRSESLSTPVLTTELFTTKPIFDEEVILGMKIEKKGETNDQLDKIFIISKDQIDSISGEIKFIQSINNDFKYTISIQNPDTAFGNGFIEKFRWVIGDQEISKKAVITSLEESSTIEYTFNSYNKQKVSVYIIDSRGQTKELTTIIDIPKRLKLSKALKISNGNEIIQDIEYNPQVHEYFINEIGVPTTLKLDARSVKAEDTIYVLDNVEWDFDSNGDIDKKTKFGTYNVEVEGNHTITVHYHFKHRKLENNTVTITEKIFIDAIKKDAVLKLNIEKDSTYVPVTVRFDASQSTVKDEDIVKFIWNYGDGIIEEGDSIVPGHKYTISGDYEINLKVISESGKEYTTSKKLILKPKPQTVKINSSMKTAPIRQGIDFISEESEGQIISYFWDFGDGEISVEANPTHFYKKPGEYIVKLKLDFYNNNVLEDTMKINIFED